MLEYNVHDLNHQFAQASQVLLLQLYAHYLAFQALWLEHIRHFVFFDVRFYY